MGLTVKLYVQLDLSQQCSKDTENDDNPSGIWKNPRVVLLTLSPPRRGHTQQTLPLTLKMLQCVFDTSVGGSPLETSAYWEVLT